MKDKTNPFKSSIMLISFGKNFTRLLVATGKWESQIDRLNASKVLCGLKLEHRSGEIISNLWTHSPVNTIKKSEKQLQTHKIVLLQGSFLHSTRRWKFIIKFIIKEPWASGRKYPFSNPVQNQSYWKHYLLL